MALSCNNVKDYVILCEDGALSAQTVSDIKEHLNSCEDCRAYYEEYGVTSLPEEPKCRILGKAITKKTGIAVAAAAGVVSLIAGAAYIVTKMFSDKD